MTKVKIEISEKDYFNHERSMTFVQQVGTAEDFEYACTKAGIAWGFDDVFADYDIMKMVKNDLN